MWFLCEIRSFSLVYFSFSLGNRSIFAFLFLLLGLLSRHSLLHNMLPRASWEDGDQERKERASVKWQSTLLRPPLLVSRRPDPPLASESAPPPPPPPPPPLLLSVWGRSSVTRPSRATACCSSSPPPQPRSQPDLVFFFFTQNPFYLSSFANNEYFLWNLAFFCSFNQRPGPLLLVGKTVALLISLAVHSVHGIQRWANNSVFEYYSNSWGRILVFVFVFGRFFQAE